MVIDMGRYTITFVVYIDDTTIRYACWRKHMPPYQPSDNYFEKRWYWINSSVLKDPWWVPRFVLSKEKKNSYYKSLEFDHICKKKKTESLHLQLRSCNNIRIE